MNPVATALIGLVAIPALMLIIWTWHQFVPEKEPPADTCRMCSPEDHKSYEGAPCSTCIEKDRALH